MEGVKTPAATEVNNIVKAYDRKSVVNDVSFNVSPGEIFGLIGPNGAGKTPKLGEIVKFLRQA